MESTTRYINIDGNVLQAEEKDVEQSSLLFYPDNPRIKSIIDAECGSNPTQDEIEKKMKSLENVKELRQSIKANKGLLEPIIVKGNVVLEGNSRLAAYRILCETDPITWGMIRAVVLPDFTSNDEIFSMLGTLHVIGKTPWNPFEQARYLQQRVTTSRLPIEKIANDLGLSPTSAKKYIKTLELMEENEDTEPSKWSYYFEYAKNGVIQRAKESYPQYEIEEIVLEKIKANEFSDAREIRKVGTVLGATSATAEEAIVGYLTGDMALNDAVELVESESKLENLTTKIRSIQEIFIKNEDTLRNNNTDVTLRYQMNNLLQTLKNILGVK